LSLLFLPPLPKSIQYFPLQGSSLSVPPLIGHSIPLT
jgi:hypothetical protein